MGDARDRAGKSIPCTEQRKVKGPTAKNNTWTGDRECWGMRHTQTERSGKATLRMWHLKPHAGERVSHAGIWGKSRWKEQAVQGPWAGMCPACTREATGQCA